MNLYTIQIAHHRKAASLGIEMIDTTVKSGIPAFAPRWDMVMGHKNGTVSDAEYTTEYNKMMRDSYITNQQTWNMMLGKDKVAIACYCKPGVFCHRHLLREYFQKICEAKGIEFKYVGEII